MGEYAVGTIATTFRVVAALREAGGAGVTELADRLDLSKSAVHNHLSTLEQLEYAVNDGGTYRLSLRFLDLGTGVRETLPVVAAGREEVDALADRTGETAALVVPEFGRAVTAYATPDGATDGLRSGSRLPLHACAAGKAILAFQGTSVEEYAAGMDLQRRTDRTITDPAELRSELRSVKDRTIAFDRGEAVADLRSVAAPVRDGDGRPVAALAVSGPSARLSGKRLEEDLPGLVLSHAKDVELELGD